MELVLVCELLHARPHTLQVTGAAAQLVVCVGFLAHSFGRQEAPQNAQRMSNYELLGCGPLLDMRFGGLR